jgi:septation ring formation regulator EzrA
MSRKPIEGNEGIIAKTVQSEVLAVGQNATAIQNRSSLDSRQFCASVSELRKLVEDLNVSNDSKRALLEHVTGLEEETKKSTPDRSRVEGALKGLASSVRMLSEFVSNASVILGPIGKIAAMFGFALL